MNETDIMNMIRIKAAIEGTLLWRNNVGATIDPSGRVVRYGLANDSKKLNSKVKSSDLVGISAAGLFVAVEVKAPGWAYDPNNPVHIAQGAFLRIVAERGGISYFSDGINRYAWNGKKI